MTSLRAMATEWVEAGRSTVVVGVVEARGSVPRGAGTRMLVCAEAVAGTIGGGHLELKAVTIARAMLAGGDTAPRRERFALGPSLGQCCGGAVTLSFAALDRQAVTAWPATDPLFHLQLHGAGHVGRAVATLLATLDCAVEWFDQRDDGFPKETTLGSPWPAHIHRICIDTVEAEVRHAPRGAFFLVLTHEHALDLRIVEAVLRRGDFAFCGLIGSKTKRAGFVHRLIERGVAADAVARLTCPIGIEGVAGKAPEIIAAAVVAQLLTVSARLPSQPSPPAPDVVGGAALRDAVAAASEKVPSTNRGDRPPGAVTR